MSERLNPSPSFYLEPKKNQPEHLGGGWVQTRSVPYVYESCSPGRWLGRGEPMLVLVLGGYGTKRNEVWTVIEWSWGLGFSSVE